MNIYEDASGTYPLGELERADAADRLAIQHARRLAAVAPPRLDDDSPAAVIYYASRAGTLVAELEGLARRLERRLMSDPERRLCAHANDGQPMHWLARGETCGRSATP